MSSPHATAPRARRGAVGGGQRGPRRLRLGVKKKCAECPEIRLLLRAIMGNRPMPRLPRLYPILDTETLARRGLNVTAAAAAMLEGGAGILQIRHKGHWSRDFFENAREAARLCRESGAALVIDDRADFAMLLGAGLHVGQDDLAPRDARKLIGSEPLLGFSSHNVKQLCAAAGEPVDYVALGPVFATRSKQNPDPVVGVEEVRRCRPLVEKPLVAIGGITRENAFAVLRAGADAVAVISDLVPEPATPRSLRERMEEWRRLLATV